MGLSRMEINFRRLLNKCEIMAKTKKRDDDRLPHYVMSLESMLKDLQSASPSITTDDVIHEYRKRIYKLKDILGLQFAQHSSSEDFRDNVVRERKLTDREELLGLRKRDGKKSEGLNDLDELIDFHQNMQQKIAEDMLVLTQNLKEQSVLANRIIKKDTEVVGRSTQLTEDNFSKLKVESNKLTEHSRRAWKCWMWVMLLIVMVVFINMVLFMKVMKKKY